MDLLEPLRRHELRDVNHSDQVEPLELDDQLSAAQERLLTLLNLSPHNYCR